MHRILLILAFLPGLTLQADAAPGAPSRADLDFFEREVRPLLVENCFKCHSADAKKLKGGLYLDSRAGHLKGGDTGPAIVPGKPEESLLIEGIGYGNVDFQMPPKSRLPKEAVEVFEKWIKMGAPWSEDSGVKRKNEEKIFDLAKRRADHWCWHGPVEVKPPEVKDASWPLSPIDHFILAKLEKAGLRPAQEADKAAWFRRVTLDLTGIPPQQIELLRFLDDQSPEAYPKVVDRLLKSPRFGEKWARHWLDLVRYAESYGHEFDYNIPEPWRYRDHVIRAFNEDVPHDQMLVEHIAGDLLEDPRRNTENGANESVVATGFWFLGEATHAPTDVQGDEADRISNQIDVLGRGFMGLTLACARCHDHKFDAISTKDYYALAGFLQSTRRQLAMLDPEGRMKEGARELRKIQQEASKTLGMKLEKPEEGIREGVIADFNNGLPEGWTMTGEAFPEAPTGFDPADVALGVPESPVAPGGVMHSGLYGRKLHGALRSPTFVLENRQIHIRMAGNGPLTIRAVIDGYFMAEFNGLLFNGTFLKDKGLDTKGGFKWKTLQRDLRKYVGHKIYLEFLDRGDGYMAIDEISYSRGGEVNVPEQPEADKLAMFMERAKGVEGGIPGPQYALAVTDGTPEDEKVHIRGGHANLGEVVPRRFLTALGGEKAPAPKSSSGRLELAKHVTDPRNPLTARVQVNRLWYHLTGRGIVPTVDDFGVMGEPPSHPELLDWLAREFVGKGWSNKKIIREIVLSRTYRMSCRPHADLPESLLAERDASNALLHCFRVRRLPGESIRDSILAVSGRLDDKPGGPSVAVHLTSFMEGRGRPKGGPLDGAGRRSIYTAIRRNFLPPFQLAFDMPVPFSTMGRRSVSNVPAQSLALMNDPLVVEQAKVWAKKLSSEPDPERRLKQAYAEAFSREPSEVEFVKASEFLKRQAALYGAAPNDERVWSDLCHVLFNKKEFIFLQ